MDNDGCIIAGLGCGSIVLSIACSILFWVAVIWAIANFVLPHLAFGH